VRRRAIAVAAALAVTSALASVVGSCSGDDGPRAAGPTTSTTGAARTSTTEAPHFTGDPGSPFCALLRDGNVTDVLGDEASAPDDVRTSFKKLVGVLDEAARLAPPEVQADAGVLAAGVLELDGALAAVGYDFDALALSPDAEKLTKAVNDPSFTVAGDRLTAYRSQVCGF
jgi:hypothetical protein